MYLYVIAAENGLFKIGKASNVGTRVLQIKSGSPVWCEVLFVTEYNEAEIDLEKKYHKTFESKRVIGEWFALSKKDLFEIVYEDDARDLISEMEKWNYFRLGENELLRSTKGAVQCRIEALGVRSKYANL